MTIKEIERRIEPFGYVSFDIFDTLIVRHVDFPSDIFRLTETWCQKHNVDIINDFCQARILADAELQKQKNGCATIDDIYQLLEHKYGRNLNHVKEVEIECEKKLCFPNDKIVKIYKKCRDAKKHIVLISDMYLSSNTISDMLKKCGIDGYEKLYISCEMGATKGAGSLYDAVLADLKISSKDIIHIGDNTKGDFIIPRLKGIKACKVRNRQNHSRQNGNLEIRTLETYMHNLSDGLTEYQRIGAKCFGPLLAGFSSWLSCECEKDDIDQIYFLARDGYTIKKAFESLDGNKRWAGRIHYLYCSRRAFTVPLIWQHIEWGDLKKNISFPHRLKAKDFIERVGLEPENYETSLQKFEIDPNQLFENFGLFKHPRFQDFYESIKKDIYDNSKEEFEALKKYICLQNMHRRIAVVDIGYHGTMQNALQQLINTIGIEADVLGYYVVLDPMAEMIKKNTICAKGYLNQNETKDYYNRITLFTPIFEAAFLATDGSLKKFKIENNEVRLSFYRNEYEESKESLIRIHEYQSGAFKYCDTDSIKFLLDTFGEINADNAIQHYIKMGTNPSLNEAIFWGDVLFSEDSLRYIANPKPPIHYLLHTKEAVTDLKNSLWKIGFLKRLFKLPIRYDKVILRLR